MKDISATVFAILFVIISLLALLSADPFPSEVGFTSLNNQGVVSELGMRFAFKGKVYPFLNTFAFIAPKYLSGIFTSLHHIHSYPLSSRTALQDRSPRRRRQSSLGIERQRAISRMRMPALIPVSYVQK